MLENLYVVAVVVIVALVLLFSCPASAAFILLA